MWSAWTESAKSSLTQALEKTGDVLSTAATNARKSAQNVSAALSEENSAEETAEQSSVPAVAGRYSSESTSAPSDKQKEILKNLQLGWSSVVENTKASIKVAQEKFEEEQHKLTERIQKARTNYYKRDPKLPLDVKALKDAEVVYCTDRIITMAHPALASAVDPEITAERKLAAVGHLLERRHDGRYMVWNLSEVEYDTGILDDQVLTFSFPGSPSPPLGLLLKLLVSMESWLKADDRNVGVVHCLTGKGRTSTVVAAFLCWMGEAGFTEINAALAYIAECKHLTPEELTIPSQRRYASYFKNMLDSVRPSQTPLALKRVIMSVAPAYAKGPPISQDAEKRMKPGVDKEKLRLGCAPYLQVFKAGKLLRTVPASLHFQQSEAELPFCQIADGSISFHVNQIVQGDILVRCRHLTAKKQRVSMYRAAFHTGYAPPKVMRLTKSQLDGACNDDRFPEDFFLDLIFEPIDAEAASKILLQETEERDESPSADSPAVKPAASSHAQALAGGSTTVRAAAYDSMLHRDSRFWDVIAARMEEHAKGNRHDDSTWGPTVGRRREFGDKKPGGDNDDNKNLSNKADAEKAALETFSIGGEFDFLPERIEPEAKASTVVARPAKPVPKKDSLMEALMGALGEDDESDPDEDVEEIVFAEDSGAEDDTAGNKEVKPSVGTESSTASTSVASASVEFSNPLPSQPESQVTAASQPDNAIDELLANANIDMDADMNALFGSTDVDIDGNLLDLDDAELEDLENFLSPTGKK